MATNPPDNNNTELWVGGLITFLGGIGVWLKTRFNAVAKYNYEQEYKETLEHRVESLECELKSEKEKNEILHKEILEISTIVAALKKEVEYLKRENDVLKATR